MSNTQQVRIARKLLGRVQAHWAEKLGRPVRIREAVERSCEHTLSRRRDEQLAD